MRLDYETAPDAVVPQRLTARESAVHLGITQELLFAYVRYAPKQALGDTFTLCFKLQSGEPTFSIANLDAWNEYLRAPWSEAQGTRPPLPSYIKDYLRVESAGQCALCGNGHGLENAHIVDYAECRSHHHHNLIRLCVRCHTKYHEGLVSRDEVQQRKAELIDHLRAQVRNGSNARPLRTPYPFASFVGRNQELGVLVSALLSARSVSIEGVGGIGKTQLLVQALQGLNDRPTLWIDVEHHATIADVEISLSTALSRSGIVSPDQSAIEGISMTEVRIVFDGIECATEAQWDDWLDFLQEILIRTAKAQIVLTSQTEVIGIPIQTRLTLGPLDEENALKILQASMSEPDLQRRPSMRDLVWLITFCEGHPFSLHLAASLIAYYKNTATVVKRLRLEGTRALKDPARTRQKRSSSLHVCLQIAYGTLTHPQRRFLQYLSNFPGGYWKFRLDDDRFFQSSDVDDDAALLLRWHWVDLRTDAFGIERLHLLSPIRAFVRAEWQENAYLEAAEIQLDVAKDFMMQAGLLHHEYMQRGDTAYAVTRFEMDLLNFLAALRHARWCWKLRESRRQEPEPYLGFVRILATALSTYFFIRGPLSHGIQVTLQGIEAARRAGDLVEAMESYVMLVGLLARDGEAELMSDAANEAVALASEAVDPRVHAMAAMCRGTVAENAGNYREMCEQYSAAQSKYEALLSTGCATDEAADRQWPNAGDREMCALAIRGRAFACELLGEYREALGLYRIALRETKEVSDAINLGSILHHIGNCHFDLGESEAAFDSYLDAAHSFGRIGFTAYLINSLSELGALVSRWDRGPERIKHVSQDLLEAGLDAISHRLDEITRDLHDRSGTDEDFRVAMNSFRIIGLVAYTTHSALLHGWAREVRESVLRPLLERINDIWQDPRTKALVTHIDLIVTIALNAADLVESNSDPDEKAIAWFAELCLRLYATGVEDSGSFAWLSSFLQHHWGIEMGEDELRSAAVRRAIS
jgi:tetratricopeptide (TPR) repeat protein